MGRPYVPFIDWLKCLGMLVILYGHLAAWAPLAVLPPINLKQVGVAFFVFITGYSLAQETGDRWRVAFNRLFEIYLFGILLALLLSAIGYWSSGRIQLSNYAPLVGGVNVIFDFFPANPTTWYLGTYFHLILIWALVAYRVRVSMRVLIASLLLEILVRMLLIAAAGRFVAYMALTNWCTVFLLGCWYGQRPQRTRSALHSSVTAFLALVLCVTIWSLIAARLPFDDAFPFMRLAAPSPLVGASIVSALVSLLYLGVTWLTFRCVEPLPAPQAVRFVARNTLIIFLGHMPVYYALWPVVYRMPGSRAVHSAILMIVCLIGLGLLSELLRKLIRPIELRQRVYASLRRLHIHRCQR